jgi:hypothetical protein
MAVGLAGGLAVIVLVIVLGWPEVLGWGVIRRSWAVAASWRASRPV